MFKNVTKIKKRKKTFFTSMVSAVLSGGRQFVRSPNTELGTCVCTVCLQCFDAVGWAAGRASGLSGTGSPG